MKNNKNLTIVFTAAIILVAVILVVIIAGILLPEHPEIIQGQAETTDYRISSKVPTRVLEIRVQEGDFVHCGDTLVVLEAPDILAKLSQAEAAFYAAQAQEQKAQNGTRTEQIQQAYEMLQKAQAGLNVAKKTYNRINNLYEQGVIAEQKRDEALANYEAMIATEKAARAQYEMACNGARNEDKAAAEAQVKRAQGVINEVSSYVDETILLAIADGEVTEIFPEVGELVGTGAPIMNISRTDDIWFTFNIREDLLPGLNVGTEKDVFVPALNKTVTVRVTKMKDVGSFAVWKATKALDGYDLKTFEVKARPIKVSDTKDIRSGMTAVMQKKI